MGVKSKVEYEWPDWRDISQYPDPKTTSQKRWAWEFLRRNIEYQKLWEERAGKYKASQFDKKERAILIELFKDKFGIVAPFPPYPGTAIPPFSLSFSNDCINHYSSINEPSSELQITIKRNELAVCFNLEWPLKLQIERAKKIFRRYAKALKKERLITVIDQRKQISHYRDYLRLLDARRLKVSYGKIAKVEDLLVHTQRTEQTVRNAIDSAEELRDGGYRFISIMSAK